MERGNIGWRGPEPAPLPCLVAAAFCERVDQRPGEAATLVNVLTSVAVKQHPESTPGQIDLTISLSLFLMLASGEAQGVKRVEMVCTGPDGQQESLFDRRWEFVPGGVIAKTGRIKWDLHVFGEHYFRLLVDEAEIARLCLQVRAEGKRHLTVVR